MVKAGIPAMIVIVRKGGTRGFQQKNLQKLDSIQSEGGPKDPILLEAPKARFQFERTHRYLKKFSGVNSCGQIKIWTKIHLNSMTV